MRPDAALNTILKLQSLRIPSNWDSIFGRHAPIHVEIGFGDGRFLFALAEQRPELNFLGIEIAYEFVRKAAKKLKSKRLWNVRLLPLDAFIALGCLFRRGEIDAVYSNFPDPWPRKRHARRRLFTSEFAHILADRLSENGFVALATDNPEFRDFAIENMVSSGYFATEFPNGYRIGLPESYPRTKYAQKWLEAGRELYFIRFRLVKRPEGGFHCPIKRSVIMPHVILEPIESLESAVKDFERMEFREDEIFVRYANAYLSADGRSALFEVFVGDWRLVQRILIQVRARENETIVKLDHINHPVVTEGVKLAVRRLARWLSERFGLEVKSLKA